MKTTLTSGNSYSIKTIFGGDYKIVIPDMQREYCWATVKPENETKSLITLFIEDLIKSIQNKSIQLGLLYAYEGPKNYIQLCDGQQRLTSLYLLLGCLHKAIEDNELSNGIKKELRKVLITDETFSEPRLQYAIRETTLFFLKDLVKNYFLGEKSEEHIDATSFIKQKDWYFQEYNQDPTIQNMLQAIDSINSLISEFNDKPSLASHILKNISFMYFDMENRTHGEEQFVVINTTGKSLTVTENIKPKILGDLDDSIQKDKFNNKTALGYYAEMWEKWEQYFWEHKNKSKQTVDFALNEFFRWIYIIESVNENDSYLAKPVDQKASQKAVATYAYNIIELLENKVELLELIDSYFEALKNISLDKELKDVFLFKNVELGQADVLRFLPLLTFVHSINSDINNRNYIRLKQFLKTRSKDDNVTKASIITSVEAIRMVKVLKSSEIEDIAVLASTNSDISITLLNKLEVFKFNAYLNEKDRVGLENLVWEAENLNTTNGNIEFILKAIDTDLEANVPIIYIPELSKIINIVKYTFENHNDLMRKALLTFGNYYIWHGDTPTLAASRYSLGNNSVFYGDLLNNDDGDTKIILMMFLQKALHDFDLIEQNSIDFWFKIQLEKFIPEEDSIFERTRNKLINSKSLINSMSKKLFSVCYDRSRSYALYSQNVTSDKSYKKISS
jgi:uncharacterized protein with ParB-like and HNH nuclease domain